MLEGQLWLCWHLFTFVIYNLASVLSSYSAVPSHEVALRMFFVSPTWSSLLMETSLIWFQTSLYLSFVHHMISFPPQVCCTISSREYDCLHGWKLSILQNLSWLPCLGTWCSLFCNGNKGGNLKFFLFFHALNCSCFRPIKESYKHTSLIDQDFCLQWNIFVWNNIWTLEWEWERGKKSLLQ